MNPRRNHRHRLPRTRYLWLIISLMESAPIFNDPYVGYYSFYTFSAWTAMLIKLTDWSQPWYVHYCEWINKSWNTVNLDFFIESPGGQVRLVQVWRHTPKKCVAASNVQRYKLDLVLPPPRQTPVLSRPSFRWGSTWCNLKHASVSTACSCTGRIPRFGGIHEGREEQREISSQAPVSTAPHTSVRRFITRQTRPSSRLNSRRVDYLPAFSLNDSSTSDKSLSPRLSLSRLINDPDIARPQSQRQWSELFWSTLNSRDFQHPAQCVVDRNVGECWGEDTALTRQQSLAVRVGVQEGVITPHTTQWSNLVITRSL